jgi:pyrroline-5-carboxylate reductase
MTSLLLIGHGKMGGALLSRWAEARPAGISHFAAIDPATTQSSSADLRFFSSLSTLPEAFKPDIIVLAVKPQQLTEILPAYAKRFNSSSPELRSNYRAIHSSNKLDSPIILQEQNSGNDEKNTPLYLSIAAGKTLKFLESQLGDAAIVRAMPNLPAVIGEGMTALCANAHVSGAQKQTASALMEAAGKIVWVEEKHMDAVTAISGSGPAYLFLFMEALAKAAVKCGLSEAEATALVRQTVKGGALLAEKNDFAALRQNVASPGGTTEAAIKTLQDKGFEALLEEAVQSALRRAGELNK